MYSEHASDYSSTCLPAVAKLDKRDEPNRQLNHFSERSLRKLFCIRYELISLYVQKVKEEEEEEREQVNGLLVIPPDVRTVVAHPSASPFYVRDIL